MSRQNQTHRLQLRLPSQSYDQVVDYAEEQDLTINGAITEIINLGLESVNMVSKGHTITSKMFYFDDKFEGDARRQRSRANSNMSDFFAKYSEYLIINFQLLSDGILCWYYKPNNIMESLIVDDE